MWALLANPIIRRVVAAFAIVAIAGAVLQWARWDAVRDYRAKLALETAQNRLETIEKDRKRDAEIGALGIDDLRNRLSEWVRD